MERLAAFWRARTGRERRLIQFAGVLLFAILVPGWIYLSVAQFRADASVELSRAKQIEANVERIAAAGARAAAQGGDSSLRGRALANAQTLALTPARIEAANEERIRIAFQPADSVAVYRWIESMGAAGGHVTRTSIVRVNDSEQVTAEFEVTSSP